MQHGNTLGAGVHVASVLQSDASTGRVCPNGPKRDQQLDWGFYGAGLPHPGLEAIVEQSNKLLMHYGCRTVLGTKLLTSIGLLLVELGMSF